MATSPQKLGALAPALLDWLDERSEQAIDQAPRLMGHALRSLRERLLSQADAALDDLLAREPEWLDTYLARVVTGVGALRSDGAPALTVAAVTLDEFAILEPELGTFLGLDDDELAADLDGAELGPAGPVPDPVRGPDPGDGDDEVREVGALDGAAVGREGPAADR